MEIHKRKGENSVSGSFQSVVGEVGVGQGSKTPVDPTLGQLVMPPALPARPKLAPDSTSVDFGDRRNMGRAEELAVQLPDPLILVGVLGRWSDRLGRLGGPQTVYRLSSLRQELQLDFIPTNDKVSDFAEALQAEAEQLALASASSMSTMTTSLQDTKKKEQVKAAALRSEGSPTSNEGGRGKPKCRFWGTTGMSPR